MYIAVCVAQTHRGNDVALIVPDLHIRIYSLCIYMYLRIYMYIQTEYIRIYTYMCILYLITHIFVYIHTSRLATSRCRNALVGPVLYMYIHSLYIYIYMCVYVYMIYMYVRVHTHTQPGGSYHGHGTAIYIYSLYIYTDVFVYIYLCIRACLSNALVVYCSSIQAINLPDNTQFVGSVSATARETTHSFKFIRDMPHPWVSHVISSPFFVGVETSTQALGTNDTGPDRMSWMNGSFPALL